MGGDIVLWMLALLISMIVFGVHIGIAFAICSALGVFLMLGSWEAALSILCLNSWEEQFGSRAWKGIGVSWMYSTRCPR